MDALPRFPRSMTFSPCRRLDWRWHRAQSLIEQRHNFSRHRDDDLTGRAVCYLRDLARWPQSLPKIHPELWAAHGIYERSGQIKAVIEARILAGQTSAEIAKLTGTPVEVVDAFENLFFNVRDRLRARDWVMAQIWKERESEAEGVLMMFAFHGGPLVLDVVLPYLVAGKNLYEPPLDLSIDRNQIEQAARLAIACQLLPNDDETCRKLSKIALILYERRQKASVPVPLLPLLTQNLDSRIETAVSTGTSEIADHATTSSVLEPASPETKQIA